MDDNTFKLLMATVAAAQVVALAYVGVQQKANGDQQKAAGDRAALDAARAANAVKRVETTLADATGATTDKLDTIHTLVNSRLTEALAKIDRLEAKLYDVTGEPPTGEPPQR